MKSFISCLLAILCLVACQNATNTATDTPEKIETSAPKATTTPKEKVEDPTQATYLQTSVGAVPIYSSFEGLKQVFEQKNDTTYVINFWATWCKPCVEELPYFEQMQEEYKDKKVQVVLISLDFKKQLERKLKPFLEERKLQSRVMVLTDNKYNNWIDRVDEIWDGAIPVTMIYNANKREFANYQFSNYEELEAVLKRVKIS